VKNFDGLELHGILHDQRKTVLRQRPAYLDVKKILEKLVDFAQLPAGHTRQRNFPLASIFKPFFSLSLMARQNKLVG
jgi:hypothetical protein